MKFLVDVSHKITKFNKEDFQLEEILDGTIDRLDHVDIIIRLVEKIQRSKSQIEEANPKLTNASFMNPSTIRKNRGLIRYNI